MRSTAVLDGTVGTAPAQTQALGAFLRDGITGVTVRETLILYCADRDKGPLTELAPTRDVRLVKTDARRADRAAEILAQKARGDDVSLLLFAGGVAGLELATRVACRTGGAVLTDALGAEMRSGRLFCTRSVYSNHMTGRFELLSRPWCVSIDASWRGDRMPLPPGHRVLSDEETDAAETSPFRDLELVEAPSTGDLAEGRFVVVAGYGAGSREGVERIASAAERMGAVFGVSRPVAMNAWAPADRLIGVSGTRLEPDLCIVAAASGAPAFYWGIEKAGCIVAIDRDERAPIVGKADVVVLDDAVAIVEELARIVAAERGRA